MPGVLAAGATVVTGWSDWADAEQRDPAVRRTGLVHAAVNGTATPTSSDSRSSVAPAWPVTPAEMPSLVCTLAVNAESVATSNV